KTVTPQAGTHLRVSVTFDGQERQKSFHKSEIFIGRANGVAKPDLDLSPDVNVSRRHARVWLEDGDCWIEDLSSKFGTQVDEEPAVSEPLARRTLAEQKGFIWRLGSEGDTQPIAIRQRVESGMYAPILCHGTPLGVICVDNPYRNSAFSQDDLRLLVAIAHQ